MQQRIMKKYISYILFLSLTLGSCSSYNQLLKSQDYDYKYEAAKEYAKAQYGADVIAFDGAGDAADQIAMLDQFGAQGMVDRQVQFLHEIGLIGRGFDSGVRKPRQLSPAPPGHGDDLHTAGFRRDRGVDAVFGISRCGDCQ